MRGSTRRRERLAEIEAAGAEGVLADPGRLATLVPHLEGVSVICWLMGTATDEDLERARALNGARLESLLAAIVDAPVRGVVYEAAGTVAAHWLDEGARTVRSASERGRIPAAVIECDPADHGAWLDEARAAVAALLRPD